MSDKDRGPAFPNSEWDVQAGQVLYTDGMTLRDYFAAHAPEWARAEYRSTGDATYTKWTFRYADAMLKERAK